MGPSVLNQDSSFFMFMNYVLSIELAEQSQNKRYIFETTELHTRDMIDNRDTSVEGE